MKILCGNCAEVMKQIESDSIDLVVTSPPYDNLRNYHSEFDINKVTQQLFRLLKQGGVVVWIVGDATINGSETGTSLNKH